MKHILLPALLASLMLQVAPASATAPAQVVNVYDQYSVSYDDTSIFGGISFSFGGGSQVGFGWNIPTSVSVVSVDTLVTTTTSFDLPSFTVTANEGYTLSGDIGGFIGNLVYTQFGSAASTSASVSGLLSVDGSSAAPMGGVLVPTATTPYSGYYSANVSQPFPEFTSFSFSDGTITLKATGGTSGFASITAQPQNVFNVSFNAVAVAVPVAIPEPETYALMLAGLGLVGFMARRRKV
jgi:hypothetical protein